MNVDAIVASKRIGETLELERSVGEDGGVSSVSRKIGPVIVIFSPSF